jgi:hypothetical protein
MGKTRVSKLLTNSWVFINTFHVTFVKQIKNKQMTQISVSLTFGRKLLNVFHYEILEYNDKKVYSFYTFAGQYIFNVTEVLAIH